MEVTNDGDGDIEDVNMVPSGSPEAEGPNNEEPANKKINRIVQSSGASTSSREESADVSEDGNYTHSSNAHRSPASAQSGTSSVSSTTVASHESAPTTTTKTEKEVMPPIEEQIARIQQLSSEVPMSEGLKGYVISNHWLEEVQNRETKGHKLGSSDAQPPVDDRDLIDVEQLGDLKDENGETFYPLKPGFTVGQEIEILPQVAWDQIIEWYGAVSGSPEIVRYCHNTSSGSGSENMIFEVYPPIFTILKLSDTSVGMESLRETNARPVKLVAARTTRYRDFLRKAKEATGIDLTSKVRVWRILSAVKQTSQEMGGMMTPAQSRSNSPALVGVEADFGNKLVLDLNTFLFLQVGSQRESIDAKDETNNDKYNGKSDLDLVGLGQEGIIVLEQQIGGPTGGEWSSDSKLANMNKLGLGNNLLSTNTGKTKSNSGSGRSSPAPGGMMTRGRAQRNGRTRGTVGLGNLGNTCYMNSALQCVKSVKELAEYFLEDRYKKELNPANPLAHNGEVAKAYASLLKEIYTSSASSSFSPRHFKQVIGKYGPSFSGYGQQDSQEFLLFLLDGLQEDLNRIHKKPYIEKPDSTDEMVHNHAELTKFADQCWDIYKARNDSVITDLFAGMYKSTVTCPVCDKVSIIFDPFNNLTLQLPIENVWARQITFFPLNLGPIHINVEIDKNATFSQLKDYISKKVLVDPKKLILAEIYKCRFYRMYDDKVSVGEERMPQTDVVAAFEVDLVPTNYPAPKKKKQRVTMLYTEDYDDDVPDADSPLSDRLLVPIFHRMTKESNSKPEQKFLFGDPSYIVLNREEARTYDLILKKVLGRVATLTTRDFLDEHTSDADSDTVLMNTEDADSSSDSRVHAHSVQGEEGMVDITMKDSDLSESEPYRSYPPAPRIKKSLPKMLQPSEWLAPETRRLFDMKYCKAKGEMVPTGWNTFSDDSKRLPSLASRLPQSVAMPTSKGKSPGDKLKRRIENGGSASSSNDEDDDLDNPPPKVDPLISRRSSGSSDQDDDDLPPVQQLMARPNKIGFSRFNKKTPRNKQGLITYSRKGKNAAAIPDVLPDALPMPEPEPLIRIGEAILLDWTSDSYNALFGESEAAGFRGAPTWGDSPKPVLPDPEQDRKVQLRKSRQHNGVTLDDCLDEFGRVETLSENDAWYCPKCKEHRLATKKFELWKAPDILVIHLKRFSTQGRLRDKLDIKVDFPVTGLDLRSRVADHPEGKELLYDLFAVDNHYGGLGGGHYTAYAQNFNDGCWYEYNDSMASKKSNPNSVVTTSAYLLFYRRRSTTPLGGPFFEKFYESAEISEEVGSQVSSRNESPSAQAGEGRRLDDSSRIGSSSAYPGVVAVHQAGGGGPEDETVMGPRTREQDDSESLPQYHELPDSLSFVDDPVPSKEHDEFGLVTWQGFGGLEIGQRVTARDANDAISTTSSVSVQGSYDEGGSPNSEGTFEGWAMEVTEKHGTPEESMSDVVGGTPLLRVDHAPQIKIHGTEARQDGDDDDEQPVADIRLDDTEEMKE